ncbi:iron chelate uptake ABC transporter family permease subunit [Halarcobacter sp.]|uniref:metal ABC transporter permease n=1 Tax=Halarcobacter sp. TaxID=2321133 RepID=UPI0029F52ED9|nr:iron chelate uptake ABC transporter family permease subunit [Halarcobacter sp.]
MLDIFSYEFIQNALLAGIIVSVITAIIGTLVVVNKMVFLSGGIAHSAYGGIGLAMFFSLPMLLTTSLFCIFVTIIIALASYKNRENLDIMIGLIWAVGMSFGILLVDLTPGYQTDLMSYLFGSLLAVTNEDIYYMSTLLLCIFIIVTVFYRDILAVSYDSEYANLRGVKTRFFYTLILILSSLTIVISIKVVGLILVIALLTIPIYISSFFCKSLISMMITSALLSILFTIIGLSLSYQFDLSSGPSIIMASSICALIVFIFKSIKK